MDKPLTPAISNASPSVLVIEDDEEICILLEEYLIDNGFKVKCVHDGATGLKKATQGVWDFVLLDIMLPVMSGLNLLRRLRRTTNVPVILLTAMGEESDRIIGLNSGADDYIVKPFSPGELLARIQSIMRRSGLKYVAPQEIIEWNPMAFDCIHREMAIDGKKLSLTDQEFETIMFLVRNCGRIVSRDELSIALLGRPATYLDRATDIRISRLRTKIAPWGDCLRGVRGQGYEFVPPHKLPELQSQTSKPDPS